MSGEDETRVSGRRRAASEATGTDEATAASSRRDADVTRLSRRRIADGATQPAEPPGATTRPAAPLGTPADGILRPPAGLAARDDDGDDHVPVVPGRAGDFGGSPQHYYPRIRHTQDATGAGVWPEPPRDTGPLAQVMDQPAREARRVADARGRRRRRVLAVAGGAAALAAAAGVALALL
ncbi:hypothetical protein [Demequina silvatica]|uniref:hypothetical protein n=1 Tax=Demequina silvatica TaxID=1638988 RepID=UPI000785F313|nr:hypothetical protein [Demequina silvatica]